MDHHDEAMDIVTQNGYFSSLPIVTYTLGEFNAYARKLMRDGLNNPTSDPRNFIRFVLTGEAFHDGPDGNADHQAKVEPLLYNKLEPWHPISICRDYDSIIGITDNIVVNYPVKIFPISDTEDAITESIHLDHYFAETEVSRRSTSISLLKS